MAAAPAGSPTARLKSWTGVLTSLYLSQPVPVPLPAVGPLAELLTVTRSVCDDINALAAEGKLAPSDVAAALDNDSVRLLGRLVQWLQAEPHAQLLLNSERQESLWQLLCITLAHLLLALNPPDDPEDRHPDRALIRRFYQQLQESGMLGQPSPSDAAAADAAAAAAAPSGILPALQWLLREHPHRCLTASAGAWLLLQELLAPAFHSHTGSQQQQGDKAGGASSSAAAASVGSEEDSSSTSDAQPADFLLPVAGPLLQAYVDRGYASAASPPTLTAAAAASGAASSAKGGGGGGGHTTPRRLASKDRVDSGTGVGSPRGPRPAPDAAAGSASPPPGTPSSLPPEFVHPICLLDDPHSEVFAALLARLHVIQVQLLLLMANERNARHAAASRDGGKRSSHSNRWQGAVPHKMALQSVAVLTSWLSQSAGPVAAAQAAAAAAGGSSSSTPAPAAHEALAPLPAVAVQAMEGLGITRPHSGVQLVLMAARDAIYTDCAHFLAAQAREARAKAAAAEAAGSSSSSGGAAVADASSGTEASTTASSVDAQLAFSTLLGCASVLHACGLPDAFLLLFEPLMASARCCDAQQVVLLIQQDGGHLLRVLTDNVASAQAKAKAKLAAAAAADERSDEAAMAAAAAEGAAKGAGAAAMIAAQVLMEVCSARGPGSRSGIDEDLLGALTEQDPPAFYTIMDSLVRHVHSEEGLHMLLPMSACFLTHDMAATRQAQRRAREQQQQDKAAAAAAEEAGGSSGGSSSAPPDGSSSVSSSGGASSIILRDPRVCRSFAAAVSGYSKGVLMPMVLGGGGGCCAHDHHHHHAEPEHTSSCGHSHHGEDGHVHGPDCGHSHGEEAGHVHGPDCGHSHGEEAGHVHGPDCAHSHGEAGHVHGPDCAHDDHHHHHHAAAMSVAHALPPLQRVADWLTFTLEATALSAEQPLSHGDASSDGPAAAGEAVAAAAEPDADAVQQLKSASDAAASGLVLAVLLSRAAVPLLQKLQEEVAALPDAAGAAAGGGKGGGKRSSSSGGGSSDALLPPQVTVDLVLGLQYIKVVFQSLCVRFFLSSVLDKQLRAAVGAAAAAGAAASGSSTAEPAAAAAAKQRAAELKTAAEECKAILQGQHLEQGWAHLGYKLPPGAVHWAQSWQQTYPGDFAEQYLTFLREQLRAHPAGGAAAAGGDGDAAAAQPPPPVLPGALRARLMALLGDAQRMFVGVVNATPIPIGCNHPGCASLTGVAEASLSVNKRCSRCLAAHYCSKECQRLHWPAHKLACAVVRGD